MQLVPGDLVCLRSGGPVLTVRTHVQRSVEVNWFANGEFRHAILLLDQVKQLPSEGPSLFKRKE